MDSQMIIGSMAENTFQEGPWRVDKAAPGVALWGGRGTRWGRHCGPCSHTKQPTAKAGNSHVDLEVKMTIVIISIHSDVMIPACGPPLRKSSESPVISTLLAAFSTALNCKNSRLLDFSLKKSSKCAKERS